MHGNDDLDIARMLHMHTRTHMHTHITRVHTHVHIYTYTFTYLCMYNIYTNIIDMIIWTSALLGLVALDIYTHTP